MTWKIFVNTALRVLHINIIVHFRNDNHKTLQDKLTFSLFLHSRPDDPYLNNLSKYSGRIIPSPSLRFRLSHHLSLRSRCIWGL